MMRIGWRIPLPGPFYVAGTVWRSRRRQDRFWWHAVTVLPGWQCQHEHRRNDTAYTCAVRRARVYGGHPDVRCYNGHNRATAREIASAVFWLALFLLFVLAVI